MRRIFSIILTVLIIALLFVSCSDNEETHQHSYVNGKCSCGEKDPNYKAPHVHNYEGGKCSCGAEDPYIVIPCTHTPSEATRENVVDATCTVTGSYEEVIKCSLCGEELSRTAKVIEKLDHTPGEATRENVVEATCTATGSYEEVVKCSVCGEELSREDKIIEKAAHTPAAATKENEISATCTSAGSYEEVIKCVDCDVEISRVTKGELMPQHKYSRGSCSVCGAADPFYTANHSHSFVDGICTGCGLTDPKYKPDYGSATVYHEGTPVTMITMNSKEANSMGEFMFKCFDIGIGIGSGSEFSYEEENEITVGRVPDRATVVMAYRLLEEMEKSSYFEARYLIYADSGHIAIAYDENIYTDMQVLDFIITEFVEKAFGNHNYLALGRGVVMSGTIDLIQKQKEIDDAKVGELWKLIDASTTPEIAAALRKCYSMYDDKLIGWYANLYDPGYGGYYCTASGRDTEGYLPDPESTKQALNFLSSSGMLNEFPGGYAENVPAFMKYQIVYYCKSIQHSNGYFYNPILPKSSIDGALAKRGRDLSWCTGLLGDFGEKPQYDAPNGTKGDGISADEYWDNLIANGLVDEHTPRPNIPKNPEDVSDILTASLGESTAYAVSKIITASEVVLADSTTAYLNDHKLFIDYMWALNLNGNPYAAGNELNGTFSQISTASGKIGIYEPDPTLGERYTKHAGKTLNEICIDILNERLNPVTGLWGDTSAKNPTGTEFLFTNGFFKIIGIYNSCKQPFPEPVKAANALLDGMVSDEPSLTNICEVYNIWSAIVSLRGNVKKYQPAAVRDEVMAIIENTLAERGAEAILVSYEKQLAYKKPDGGYSHHVVGSATSHQGGIPTGLGLNEGDVDAIGKATTGLFPLMLDMLNLPDIPLYTTYNWMQYLEILMELQPVQKYSYDGEVSTGATFHDFDTDPGSTYFKYTSTSTQNKVYVTTEGENGILKLEKKDTTGQLSASIFPNIKKVGADVVVFETDVKFASITKNESFAINLGTKNAGHDSRITRLHFAADSQAAGSKIRMSELIWSGSGSSATINGSKIDTGAVVGEWFNVKITYYEGDINTPGTSRIKVQINGTTIYVSDDLYSKHLDATQVIEVLLLTMTNFVGDIYFDNMSFTQERDGWVDEPLTPDGTGSGSGSGSNSGSGSGSGTTDPTKPTDVKISFEDTPSMPILENNFRMQDASAYYSASSTDGVVTDSSGNTVSAWKGTIAIVGTEDKYLHVVDYVSDGGDSGTATTQNALNKDVGQAHLLMDKLKGGEGLDMFVYEMKVRFGDIEGVEGKNSFTFFDMSVRKGSARAARLYFSNTGKGGAVQFKLDYAGAETVTTDIKAPAGEWFTIRLEYIASADSYNAEDFKMRVYINGNLCADISLPSSHTYCKASEITRADLLISKSFVGIIDIDDITVKFADSKTEPAPTPILPPPHEHSFTEGKCECGEIDPTYTPPHEHEFDEGKCECGEVDQGYVPHEHNFIKGKCECGEADPNYIPEPNVTIIDLDGVTAFPISQGALNVRDESAYGKVVSSDGETFTDSNGDYISAWKGSIAIVDEGDDKYISVYDPRGSGKNNNGSCTAEDAQNLDVGQGHIMLKGDFGEGNKIVYEMKVRFSKLEGGEYKNDYTYLDLSLRQGSTRLVRLYFANDGDNHAIKYKLSVSDATQASTTDIEVPLGEWFTVRLEFVDSGDEFDPEKSYFALYFNDKLAVKTNAETTEKYTTVDSIDRIDLLLSRAFIGCVDFGDITITTMTEIAED